jgi:hypothetical protein
MLSILCKVSPPLLTPEAGPVGSRQAIIQMYLWTFCQLDILVRNIRVCRWKIKSTGYESFLPSRSCKSRATMAVVLFCRPLSLTHPSQASFHSIQYNSRLLWLDPIGNGDWVEEWIHFCSFFGREKFNNSRGVVNVVLVAWKCCSTLRQRHFSFLFYIERWFSISPEPRTPFLVLLSTSELTTVVWRKKTPSDLDAEIRDQQKIVSAKLSYRHPTHIVDCW